MCTRKYIVWVLRTCCINSTHLLPGFVRCVLLVVVLSCSLYRTSRIWSVERGRDGGYLRERFVSFVGVFSEKLSSAVALPYVQSTNDGLLRTGITRK